MREQLVPDADLHPEVQRADDRAVGAGTGAQVQRADDDERVAGQRVSIVPDILRDV